MAQLIFTIKDAILNVTIGTLYIAGGLLVGGVVLTVIDSVARGLAHLVLGGV